MKYDKISLINDKSVGICLMHSVSIECSRPVPAAAHGYVRRRLYSADAIAYLRISVQIVAAAYNCL